MQVENSNTEVVTISDPEVEVEANRLIATSAARNGVSIDAIPEEAKQQAREHARATLEKAAKDEGQSHYRRMYLESQERLKTAEAQLSATRESRVRSDDNIIVTTAESVQRRDPLAWHKMSIPQRLASVGADPNVDRAEVARFFGKNSDHKSASDLMRVDQRRYKVMREVARILGIL
jgi:hypothetical protein